MRVERATLISFDSATYTATVRPSESLGTYLLSVPVSGHLSSGLMVAGLEVAIMAFDEHISGDRLIVGVWGSLPAAWVTSAMIVDGAIVNADVNASAAIVVSKLAAGTFPAGAYVFAFSSSLTISGTGNILVVDTSTLVVDGTNHRVGIGAIVPAYSLQVSVAQNAATVINVTNTTSGTAARSALAVGSSVSVTHTTIDSFSAGYTAAGADDAASGSRILATGSGGLAIRVSDNAGDIRYYVSNSGSMYRVARMYNNVGYGSFYVHGSGGVSAAAVGVITPPSSHAGYLEIYAADGVRNGYMGYYTDGALHITPERSNPLIINGRALLEAGLWVGGRTGPSIGNVVGWRTGVIANNGTYDFTPSPWSMMTFLEDTYVGMQALYFIGANWYGTVIIAQASGSYSFSTAHGTAGKVNIAWTSATNLRLENKTGGSVIFSIMQIN